VALLTLPAESTGLLANCTASEVIGDLVYVFAPFAGGQPTVARVDPATITKMPAWGFIIDKPSATLCTLKIGGLIPFVGASDGSNYFVGADGRPTATPPAATPGGMLLQRIGVGYGGGHVFFAPEGRLTRYVT